MLFCIMRKRERFLFFCGSHYQDYGVKLLLGNRTNQLKVTPVPGGKLISMLRTFLIVVGTVHFRHSCMMLCTEHIGFYFTTRSFFMWTIANA